MTAEILLLVLSYCGENNECKTRLILSNPKDAKHVACQYSAYNFGVKYKKEHEDYYKAEWIDSCMQKYCAEDQVDHCWNAFNKHKKVGAK